MYYFGWALTLIIWIAVGGFLHYTLPQHDIVRVSNTEVRRIDLGENALFWSNPGTGNASGTVSRDVFFIDSFRPNNKPRVYRNEDTGWGWPPYFKLDAANLQAEMQDLISTKDNPNWVAMRHYGWRFEPLSIYPNAVRAWPVDGPDARIINWFNIVFLSLFVAFWAALWIRWRRFREARIDPVLEDMGDGLDAAGETLSETGGRMRRWLRSWGN